jgi:hypothetical protein
MKTVCLWQLSSLLARRSSFKVPNLNVEKNRYVSYIISVLLVREFSFAGA